MRFSILLWRAAEVEEVVEEVEVEQAVGEVERVRRSRRRTGGGVVVSASMDVEVADAGVVAVEECVPVVVGVVDVVGVGVGVVVEMDVVVVELDWVVIELVLESTVET